MDTRNEVKDAAARGWQLVWSDEFDRAGLPDPARWGYEEGFVRNEEAQYYTRGRLENARIENSLLIIEARREPFRNPLHQPDSDDWRLSRASATCTSASISTQHKASWTYGRFEVRAQLPRGRGVWPAAWMLGTNIETVNWPRCGEIDIMEYVGYQPDTIHATMHAAEFDAPHRVHMGSNTIVPAPYDAFHVYAIEWDHERIACFVDDRLYYTFVNDGKGEDSWPFDAPQYLILNLAIGGGWGGREGIDDAIFPQRYLVDYVRVYQRKAVATP